MRWLLLVLAQAAPLNLNEAPIQVRDEGTVQSPKRRAYAINCVGTSVACTQDGGVMRLEVTAGGGGGSPVDAGYVVWGSNSTGSTNERALTSGTNTTVDTGTAGQVKVNLSGTVPVANGGTNLTTADEDATVVGNGTTWQAKTLPSCSNATTSKLLYDTSTNAFSCGTDQTGGGGGTSPLILGFGAF